MGKRVAVSTEQFEEWVWSTYRGASPAPPPPDWNPAAEFFYRIENLQFRIPYADLPTGFSDVASLGANVFL